MSACHAAVELGGTRAAVLAGVGPERRSPVIRLATGGPDETLAAIAGALRRLRADGWDFASVGLACFGPLELDPDSPGFGRLLATPKPGWSGADVAGVLARELEAPVLLETDVNAAAIGEGRWGACQGLGDFAYVTAGTGVGAGVCVKGAPVHGLLHPEAGHLRPRRDPRRDGFEGSCRWHGDCVEGLASGPAIAARLGRDPAQIGDDDPVWELAGDYLGQLCAALALIVSPRRIVLGGGVGRRPRVLQAARRSLEAHLSGYLARPKAEDLGSYLVAPALGADSGLLGALALAQGRPGTPDAPAPPGP
jgi:fructokinase